MLRPILFVLVMCSITAPLKSQQSHAAVSEGAPTTSKAALKERGIGLESGSLKAALGNSDAYIRGLAAMALASSQDTSAASDIEVAMAKEKDPYSRLKMAGSLFTLDPSSGLHYMTDICQDPQTAKGIRLNAASALMILDRNGISASACVPQLFSFLKDEQNPLYQTNALSLLNSYRSKLKPAEVEMLRQESLKNVTSRDFGLKAASVHSLIPDDSPEAKNALQRAVDEETNPAIKTS